MRSNYAAHEMRYRQLRAEGASGWTTDDEVDQIMEEVEAALSAPYAPRGGRALDLGCGAGEVTLRLAAMGFEVFATDISETAIAWVKEKAAERSVRADFRAANVLDPSCWPEGFFGFALDSLCLHCIIGRDRAVFLNEVRRVLRPGGLLHVHTMCGQVTDPLVLRDFDPLSRCHVIRGDALRYIGLADAILEEIADAGFEIRRSAVRTRETPNDQDDLIVDATKPA